MRALTVAPGEAGSARLEDLPEPEARAGEVLVRTVSLGVCGTDREILQGAYGQAPAGRQRMVLGHESLGRVVEAPPGSGLSAGDWVCGVVRRPDPLPCTACARGEWDMCRNGRYRERGIKELDGFAAERWRTEATFAVRVEPRLGALGVLVEPASIVAKAWDHIDRIGRRAHWEPERVLVIGAGTIGLLAALLGAQRGLEVHVLDQVTAGPKPRLVAGLGARYHTGTVEHAGSADVVIECTGVPSLVLAAMFAARAAGIVCLVGVSPAQCVLPLDAGALDRALVLDNNVIFGAVNANRAHVAAGAAALAQADAGWLAGLITRRVPLARWPDALAPDPLGVKTIISFEEGS